MGGRDEPRGRSTRGGGGHRYLIEHSAGSGKTNTIAWTAHRLPRLHVNDEKVFDSVIVVVDRTVLDGQLQKIRYDNLRAAVAQVLGFARQRVETARWTAFRSHYGVDVFYCQPGLQGAHEKGGVEGQIGWFRRNHLVPVPEVDSLDQLNAMVDAWDTVDDARRIGSRAHTVGELFAIERPLLAALPDEAFETGTWLGPRVDR